MSIASHLQRWSQHVLGRFWRRFLHEPPPEQAVTLAARFVSFGAGMAVARVTAAVAQIVLGRVLGPAAYGELTIVLLLAGYLALPIGGGWGLAFIKRTAGQSEAQDALATLKALLLLSAAAALAVSAALLTIQHPLSAWLGISAQQLRLALIVALAYAWWTVAKQVAQAFAAWQRYVLIEVGSSAVVLVAVLALLRSSPVPLYSVGLAFAAAYGLAGLGSIAPMARSLRCAWRPEAFRALLTRGSLLVASTVVATAAFGIDRLLIQRSLDAAQVGLYQAHFLATYGMVGALMTIVITYLFPLFCREDVGRLAHWLPALCIRQYPVTLAGSALVGYLILRLYGYPLQPLLFASLCAFNAIEVHLQLRAYSLAGRTLATTRRVLASQLVFLLVNVAVLALAVHRIGILAGGLALVASALAALVFLYRFENVKADF